MSTVELFPSRPIFSGLSVSQQVSEFIRAAIIKGVLKPNQHLREESIAKELNVSRTPVREAIRRLESEGLIEYVTQRGAVVRPVSQEEISQIYDVRILLEAYAAKLAATTARPQNLSVAEDICASFQAILNDESNTPEQVSKLIELNNRFHSAITDMSGNVALARILKVVLQVPQIYRAYYWYDKSNRTHTSQMHQCVLDAIKERDSVRAEQLMQQHLVSAKDLILKALERIKSFPEADMR